MPANIRCFVAMAFDRPDTDAMFAVIRRTLKPLGIVPRRVDRIEHNDNIDQKIISELGWFNDGVHHARHKFEVHCGVSLGDVVFPDDKRIEDETDEALDLAAALCEAAPSGALWVARETQAEVADGAGFSSVDQHVLGQEVREWRPGGAKPAVTMPAAMPQVAIPTQVTRTPVSPPSVGVAPRVAGSQPAVTSHSRYSRSPIRLVPSDTTRFSFSSTSSVRAVRRASSASIRARTVASVPGKSKSSRTARR